MPKTIYVNEKASPGGDGSKEFPINTLMGAIESLQRTEDGGEIYLVGEALFICDGIPVTLKLSETFGECPAFVIPPKSERV